VLAGSSIREAYVDARDQMGRAIFTAEEILNTAQQQIAAQIDTRGEGQAVLLFNPHPFPVSGIYETENQYGGGMRTIDLSRAHLFTDDDQPLPVQHVRPTAASSGVDRLLFPVELPALGYRLYRLKMLDSTTPEVDGVQVGQNTLENAYLRVSVQPDGIQVEDVRHHRHVLRAPGIRALIMEDASDTWGHDYYRYDALAGEFSLVGVRILEQGPLRGGLRAEYVFGRSRMWLDIYLDHDRRAVELRGKLWWLERQRLLKMAFPVNVDAESATHEIPYAALARPNNGEEEPMQQWIDIADATAGLTVINDGRYSVSVVGQEIRQTILRSVPFAWVKCKMYPWDGENIDWQDEDWMQDQGIEEFRLLLLPHDGDREAAHVAQESRLFNRHPALMVESAHPGSLPAQYEFLHVAGDHVRVEVMKGAEDGRGVILRAVETAGEPTNARFSLPEMDAPYETSFTPWEIKTFRLFAGCIGEEEMLENIG
jgi:alpha-mannosidase